MRTPKPVAALLRVFACLAVAFAAAVVLPVPMASAHEGAEVLIKTTESWNGKTLPAYPTAQPEVTILRITVPPKSKLPWHKHLVINAGYLISGELTVISESGKELQLKAGDVLVELVGTYHYGRNDGDEPAVIVVFYAGKKDGVITELKDAGNNPADPAVPAEKHDAHQHEHDHEHAHAQ